MCGSYVFLLEERNKIYVFLYQFVERKKWNLL